MRRRWRQRMCGGGRGVSIPGFTLVELLVVIAIIGVLVALLLPAVQAAREAARRTACHNKLHQIGIALHNYHSSHERFPYGAADGDCESNTEPRHPHTWRTMLLPFLEQQAVYDELDKIAAASVVSGCYPVRPWDRSPLQQQIMEEYICPSDAEPWLRDRVAPWSGPSPAAIASYQGNAGPIATGPRDWGLAESCGICVGSIACPCIFGNTPERNRGFFHGHNPDGPGMLDMWPNNITISKVTDGTSKTIHVGETHAFLESTGIGCRDQVNWLSTWGVASTVWGINHGAPLGENWQSHCNYRSFHAGGANFLFVDGSVRFLEASISPALFGNLGARNDGNVGDEYVPPQSPAF